MSVFPGTPDGAGGGTTDGLTDQQLRASPVPVNVSNTPTVTIGNTPVGANASVTTFTNTSSAQILGSNGNRKIVTIFNSTPNVLYVLLGSGTASSTNYSFALGEKEILSLSNVTCAIQGIYATSGTARVTEVT